MSIVREGPTPQPDIESASRGKLPGGQSEDKAAFTEDGTWTGFDMDIMRVMAGNMDFELTCHLRFVLLL